MFSPTKVVVAGALVFALGGTLLVTQSFDQEPGPAPGAETDAAVAPAFITGTVRFANSCSGPVMTSGEGMTVERDFSCAPQSWTSTDPRFGGRGTVAQNADSFEVDGTSYSIVSSVIDLRGDDGGWRCVNHDRVVVDTVGLFSTGAFDGDKLSCTGDGSNAGLSAIITANWVENIKTIEGIVFAGEGPPLPELPAQG